MKEKFIAILLGFILCVSCQENAVVESEDKIEQDESIPHSNKDYMVFVEEILVGFDLDALSKHMVQTPYQYLGEINGRYNYEGQDANKVDHFVSFATYSGNHLEVYVYNLDFKHNNENLVMEYQQKLQAHLTETYGNDFETGYDSEGNYVVDWVLKSVQVYLNAGTNYITLEVKER